MPNMANITVKKNDGTTDVVYTQQIPSAGDRSPAIWRNLTVGTAAAQRPELRASSHMNGTNTARRVEANYKYPTTVTGTDGKVQISDVCILTITGVIPQNMPDADLNEAVSQGLNLAASTLIKDTFKSGFAPS